MKILFLSRWVPYPPDNGSKIRISNLIKQLSVHHQVDLISFAAETVSEKQVAAAHQYCRHVSYVKYRPFRPSRLTALMGFFSQRPRSLVDTYSVEMQKLVEQVRCENPPDVVIASQIDMASYAIALPNVPKIFEELELTVLYEKFFTQRHPLKRLRERLMWWKSSRYVTGLLRAFDGCTVVSEQERQRVLLVSPAYNPIRIVPNGIDTAYYAADFGTPVADSLVFSGALTYFANFDAMSFFLREILPLLQAERPGVKLSITGKLDGVPIDQLPHNSSVVFTGYLDDVRPTIAHSWVSVVPMRMGGGTRVKILESLALGTPIVATSKGAEGLDLAPGRDLLIADEPADFAAAILRLLQDATLRETLSRNGRQAVEAKYDWQIIGQQFNEFIECIISSR